MGPFRLTQLWPVRAGRHAAERGGLPGAGRDAVVVGAADDVERRRSVPVGRWAATAGGRRAVRRILSGLTIWHWIAIALIAGPWVFMLYIKYLVLIAGVEAIFPRVHVP